MSILISEPSIAARGLGFSDDSLWEQPICAPCGSDLDLVQGDYLVGVDRNSCGKPALAEHSNAMLRPTGEGEQGTDRCWAKPLGVRCTVGMACKVPGNQLGGNRH